MKKHELTVEIVKKRNGNTIKVNFEKLEADKKDVIIWKRKNTADKYAYSIIFPEHSPFSRNEFKMGTDSDTGDQAVVYNYEECGWKRFKYLIIASDGTEVLFLDPELIIPKNARAEF